jgi:ATP synthase F1 delta subunit
MKISPKQYAQALFEVTVEAKEKEIKSALQKLALILVKNNDLGKLNKIFSIFSELWNKNQGIVEAEITSARELDSKIVKLLNGYIIKLSGADTVKIEEKVNQKILGGVIIKYGDKILDASMSGKLLSLKEKLS